MWELENNLSEFFVELFKNYIYTSISVYLLIDRYRCIDISPNLALHLNFLNQNFLKCKIGDFVMKKLSLICWPRLSGMLNSDAEI